MKIWMQTFVSNHANLLVATFGSCKSTVEDQMAFNRKYWLNLSATGLNVVKFSWLSQSLK